MSRFRNKIIEMAKEEYTAKFKVRHSKSGENKFFIPTSAEFSSGSPQEGVLAYGIGFSAYGAGRINMSSDNFSFYADAAIATIHIYDESNNLIYSTEIQAEGDRNIIDELSGETAITIENDSQFSLMIIDSESPLDMQYYWGNCVNRIFMPLQEGLYLIELTIKSEIALPSIEVFQPASRQKIKYKDSNNKEKDGRTWIHCQCFEEVISEDYYELTTKPDYFDPFEPTPTIEEVEYQGAKSFKGIKISFNKAEG